jgi:putative transposase
MVDRSHPQMSIVRQCALLQISPSGRYYQPVGESDPTLALMRLIDEAFVSIRRSTRRQVKILTWRRADIRRAAVELPRWHHL